MSFGGSNSTQMICTHTLRNSYTISISKKQNETHTNTLTKNTATTEKALQKSRIIFHLVFQLFLIYDIRKNLLQILGKNGLSFSEKKFRSENRKRKKNRLIVLVKKKLFCRTRIVFISNLLFCACFSMFIFLLHRSTPTRNDLLHCRQFVNWVINYVKYYETIARKIIFSKRSFKWKYTIRKQYQNSDWFLRGNENRKFK